MPMSLGLGLSLMSGGGPMSAAPNVPPLDGLTAPFAAYGLRQLLTTYVGPLVKLRRSSDSAVLDFNAGVDGWLNQSAVTTWAGGTVFVDTLYDQSGNLRDATQATVGNQPALVWGQTGDNRPGMAFLTATPNARLVTATQTKASGPISMIAACRRVEQLSPSTSGAMNIMLWGTLSWRFNSSIANDYFRGDLMAFGNLQTSGSAPRAISAALGPGDRVFTAHLGAGGSDLKLNGGTIAKRVQVSGAVPAISSQVINIGNDATTHPLTGHLGEIVIWTADMSASLGTLEARMTADYAKDFNSGYTYYPSTIDAATFPAMEVKPYFKVSNGLKPILVMMHSWNSGTNYFLDADAQRFTDDYFVIVPGLRASLNGTYTAATRDASGREIQDIIDAVRWARAKYPSYAHPTKAVIAGWSGGSGNVLMALTRFPDFFMAASEMFGMSDYGHNATYGWYNTNNATYGAQIVTSIGDTPTNIPDDYLARKAIDALPVNMKSGFLWMFHDDQDVDVSVEHSRQLVAAMNAAGNALYVYRETTTTDNPRWAHQAPSGSNQVIQAEAFWRTQAAAMSPTPYPNSGTVKVRGWIEFTTVSGKLVRINLSTALESEAADVVYDTGPGTYTVTPVSADPTMTVTITQNALSASGTFAVPTLLTVA